MPTLLALTVIAYAQDPYAMLPRNYRLEFENDAVRVSRVKYEPGDRLAVHSHPSIPTVYVYLTDGGAIRFTHKTPQFTLERPPVKAGGVRFNRNAQEETHEVEYLGDTPSEYLRIELKTTPGPRHRDARLRNEEDFPWEDPQVRISRLHGKAPAVKRALLVDIEKRSFVWLDGANTPPAPRGLSVLVELK
uniref:Uncharacterized protein n=1 Tax=Solibacter usitatus (strain Ellin6076) TaxID=234267 RepID=Q01VW6_SOLUE